MFGKPALRKAGSLGFTLTELLMALQILAVIATFTIPKILNANQLSTSKAIAKEVAGTVAQSYQLLQMNGGAAASTNMGDVLAYLNYVKMDTSTPLDGHPQSNPGPTCSATVKCYKMHNGAILWYWTNTTTFNGTTNLNGLDFCVDPDASRKAAFIGNDPSKSVCFYLYYNGRVTSYGKSSPNTTNNVSTVTLDSSYDPSWFTWD